MNRVLLIIIDLIIDQLNDAIGYILTNSPSLRMHFFKSLENRIRLLNMSVTIDLEEMIRYCFRRISREQQIVCLSAMSCDEEPILFSIFP